jgi:hypothetical protein
VAFYGIGFMDVLIDHPSSLQAKSPVASLQQGFG